MFQEVKSVLRICFSLVDPCIPSPCQNGGQCRSTVGSSSYVCDCPPTFIGQNCDTRKLLEEWPTGQSRIRSEFELFPFLEQIKVEEINTSETYKNFNQKIFYKKTISLLFFSYLP